MYSQKQLESFGDEYSQIKQKYVKLLSDFYDFSNSKLQNSEAREYALQGFLRRITTLKRCIEIIYNICSPECPRKLTEEEQTDITINLQSFIFNVFGCIDNLAWVLVKEHNLQLNRSKVTFSNTEIRNKLSHSFLAYWDEQKLKDWRKYLEDFRHALAHRIPPYIPPFCLSPSEADKYAELENQKSAALRNLDWKHGNNHHATFETINQLKIEQEKLGDFIPVMKHSFTENSPFVAFHAQILKDWITVINISYNFINEFNNPPHPSA